VRCSPRSPPAINTNGADGGCEESCIWCREPSGARRGWINIVRSASPRRPHALRFPGMARGGVQLGRPQQSIPTERPAGVKTSVFGAKRSLARAVGG
jgi:hypothetical protein